MSTACTPNMLPHTAVTYGQPQSLPPADYEPQGVTVYVAADAEPRQPSCCWATGAVCTMLGLVALALATIVFPSASDYQPREEGREDDAGLVVLVLVVYGVPPIVVLLLAGCIILAIARHSAPRRACRNFLIAAAAVTLVGSATGLTIFAIRAHTTNEHWTGINAGWQLVTGIVTAVVLIAIGIMTVVYRATAPQAALPHHHA